MNKEHQVTLIGSAVIALAILSGSVIIAEKLSRSLDEKDFWAGSNIPQVAGDVHNITTGLGQAVGGIGLLFNGWTRA